MTYITVVDFLFLCEIDNAENEGEEGPIVSLVVVLMFGKTVKYSYINISATSQILVSNERKTVHIIQYNSPEFTNT